ncbi:alpha/beta hydrolase [Stappia sp. F7233]|uniref:Alpha/beta hydrolase n=1 Tax=Stappia albiluteola TaxID=2758565 RepID=A0A839ACP5_9HYPH|nr:alpha/beta hydrolase [Stappia albiluteola]
MRPERKPVVLLHGWSCHGGFFKPQFSALAGETLVIAPDLPGHGGTGDKAELAIESAADEVSELFRAENLRDVVLVGWSMGAHVAYSLVERHGSARLACLVVEDMTAKVLNDDGWRLGTSDGTDAGRNAEILCAIEPYWPQFSHRIAGRIFAEGSEPDPKLLAFAVSEIASADPKLLRPMWASLTSQDFRALLSEIDIPVHLATGARSALYRRDVALWQAEHIRQATIHTFDASGHAPHLEEPDKFNALLLDLVTGVR